MQKIKGGRWTVTRFATVSVSIYPRLRHCLRHTPLYLLSLKLGSIPAGGLHHRVDAHILPSGLVQGVIRAAGPAAHEHRLFFAVYPSTCGIFFA